MIEQALFFAIGFLAATLAAIVALPALVRRAARLYEARSRLQAPATEKQALAERDALRAQHAVECARIERRATLAEERAVALRSESGRQAVRLIALEADTAEIETLRREKGELEGALTASQTELADLSDERDKAVAAEAEASRRIAEVEAEASRDRARIAILGARSEQMEGRHDELSRSARSAAEAAEQTQTELQAAREAEARRAADLEDRLRATLADRDAELKAAEAKAKELEALLDAREREARAVTSSASERAGSHAAALTSMEEALKASRAERDALQQETDELRAKRDSAGEAADAALREAIARLGGEVARLWAERSAAIEPGTFGLGTDDVADAGEGGSRAVRSRATAG